MFLKNCWYVAAWPSELGADNMLSRQILGQAVLLYRTGTGAIAALLDSCPHRLVPLSAGRRIGDEIRCGYHGMTFAADGRCTAIPGQDRIPDTARATAFPVVERHGHIWIWMGDPKLADPALVPHVPWPGLDHWTASVGYTHVQADYRLLTDNLLDLSHENYIHGGTLANSEEETISSYPVRISTEAGCVVRAHRDMPDIVPPPFFRMMADSESRIDRWQTAIWTAPSVNMTDVGVRPVGAPREANFVSRVLHMLTPETESSSHYFWSHNRNFRRNDEALTERIVEAHRRTFDEDRDMLELQQAKLEKTKASVPQVALRVDDAPLRARRFLNALIRQEQEAGDVQIASDRRLIPDDDALEAMVA